MTTIINIMGISAFLGRNSQLELVVFKQIPSFIRVGEFAIFREEAATRTS